MSVSTKMRLAPNCVKFKIPSLEEGIKHEFFNKLNKTHLEIRCDGIYVEIPRELLGKEVIFQTNTPFKKDDDGVFPYVTTVNKKRFFIYDCDLNTWHGFAKLVEGKLIKPPIDIGGDNLIYDSRSKVFRCGCKTISPKLANEIFVFIGEHLGYEIAQ